MKKGKIERASWGAEYDVSRDPVMMRIGLTTWNAATSRWSWEIANWYVTFAQKDLELMSQGDWLNLQEELMTWRGMILHEDDPSDLGREELRVFQKEVLRRLNELADHETLDFDRPKTKVLLNPLLVKHRPKTDKRPLVTYIGPKGLDGLLYHFGELLIRTLEKNPNAIRRCPHCRKIFIQLRRHSRYCSRVCQSRAAVQGK